jgi:hypothetical protein
VFVTTRSVTFTASAWTWNWSSEPTSNSEPNSANLERRLLKCYDVCEVMKPCVVQHVSNGTCSSREAEHHSKTTRGQGDLPPTQPPTNVETIRWLVQEDRRISIKEIAAIAVQCRQLSIAIWTCRALLLTSCPGFWPLNR